MEKRYTLNRQTLTSNKGDLADYIDGIYDWYNNEKLDWFEVLDRLNEQDDEINDIMESCYGKLQFAKWGDFTICRDERGNYKVYSENVNPKDSPIIIIKAPDVIFNEFIIGYITKLIEKYSNVYISE